ncbi:hypothetical protein SeLEV6574_g00864 [Synchytrium endobioticum]|uniref:60S ribosomal protein L17 n=1 Tax=Synchytrium endobioticum TaxID=286115 RepID=A0A507DGG4_9FUNG|nr:hypothetical protein SeLEV6574_g00864 [Synchytrium endobioticum]
MRSSTLCIVNRGIRLTKLSSTFPGSDNQPPLPSQVRPLPANNPSEEILLTESVHGRRRYYQQLSGTSHLVWDWKSDKSGLSVFERLLPRRLASYLRTLFLPIGYPSSVHPTYAKVHFWQFIETYIGSMVGVLCSEAMLTSLGVGAPAAAGGAVAIQWVLKDGFGEIGKLFFIQRYAKSFDSHPKSWKILGEVSSLTGSLIQICTVISPSSAFLPLASLGYACRSIHFSVWAATHMTFTRNFALQGNVGDIVAKDDSQMSVAHLLGLVCGVGLISFSHSPAALFTMYAILGPLHFYSTLKLVREAQFEVLNGTKLVLISDTFVNTNIVPTMRDLRPRESWFGESIARSELGRVPNVLVAPVARLAFENVMQLKVALEVLRDENYLLCRRLADGKICVVLHQDAVAMDVIKSVLHSVRYHYLLQEQSHELPSTTGSMQLDSIQDHKMVRYSVHDINPTKSAKTRGSYLRVHFKNTRETAMAVRGMKLKQAQKYLEAVKNHEQAVPFRRFSGGVGRTAQAKVHGVTQARWPTKSATFLMGLLKNAEANAAVKGLNVENLFIKHIQVNQAPKQRRRTYRAHGRINPYMASPSHIEVIVAEEEKTVKKEADTKLVPRLSRRRAAARAAVTSA